MNINFDPNKKDDTNDENEESIAEESVNIPLNGSPLYPHIYVGDSATPLMGQFPESEYVDDNISRTYLGLMSIFGTIRRFNEE